MALKIHQQNGRDMRRAGRPVDAATLVLTREIDGEVAVLMGQRNAKHRFMPDHYVFPGGRVDRSDGFVVPGKALRAAVAQHLQKSATAHRARAIAMAAVRETFEETGLLISDGKPMTTRSQQPSWRAFFAAGGAPDLSGLDYFCRAITPPFRPIRFDARFFLADGRHLRGQLQSNGELLYLDWLPLRKALELNVPGITKIVLKQLPSLLALKRAERDRQGALFHRFLHGRRIASPE